MPKYDAFGRKVGENTLAGLGSTSADTSPQKAASEAGENAPMRAAPRAATPTRAPQRDALAGQLRDALAQVRAARARRPSPSPLERRRRRGRLPGLLIGLVLFGVGLVLSKGDERDTSGTSSTTPSEPAAATPRGLAAGSLVRRANLAPALRQLRATGLRLTNLRLAPERIDAQLLTRDGRLRSVQLKPGGRLERSGSDSGPGFDASSTLPFARLSPAAPARLARRGAAELHVPVATLQYLVPTATASGVAWAAYFDRGRYVVGDAAGRYQRSYR